MLQLFFKLRFDTPNIKTLVIIQLPIALGPERPGYAAGSNLFMFMQ